MFKVEDGIVHDLLELENGNLAMTGIKDSKIRIFDFISGRLKKELEGHNDYVMEMKSIPSKHTLLSYSCDKTIKLWSTKHNFMLLKSIERPGIINKLFIFNPELLLIQESQGTYFKPNNITQILSLKVGIFKNKFVTFLSNFKALKQKASDLATSRLSYSNAYPRLEVALILYHFY